MRKTIIHQFDPVIYPVKLWVTITREYNSLAERFEQGYNNDRLNVEFLENKEAVTYHVREKSSKLRGVLIVYNGLNYCSVRTIAHEASHACDFIWEYIGETRKGDEAKAYLMGWIAECIEKVKRNKE
jgi:hypothetical protein